MKHPILTAVGRWFFLLAFILATRPEAGEKAKQRTLDDDYRLVAATIDSVEKMERAVALEELSPFWKAKVDRQLGVFRETRDGLRSRIQKDPDSAAPKEYLETVMRVHPENFGASGEAWVGFGTRFTEARDTLMQFANHPEIRPKLLAALGNDSALNRITGPIVEIHLLQLNAGIARNQEKIRRYGIKYGSGSARLNLLETALNYWVLQKVPGIGSNEEGPGHLEVIASYSTAYFVLYNTGAGEFSPTPTLASVFEGGLRYYIYRPGWGRSGIVDRILHPSYITLGGLMGDSHDGFLRLPIHGDLQWGIFGSWGDFKLAFQGLNDPDRSRLLLSRQFQFIPYLF